MWSILQRVISALRSSVRSHATHAIGELKNITYGIGTEGGAGGLARSPVVDYQVAQRIQPETLEAQSTAQSQPKKYISNIKKSQMKYF